MLPLHNKLLVLIATDFGVKTSLSNKSLTLAAIYPAFILKVGLLCTAEVIPYQEQQKRVTKVES